jgi:hypothetical protein
MKRATFIFLAAITCMAAPAFAKKKGKKNSDGKGKGDAAIVQQFDRNGNRQIDGEEVAALKSAFAAAAPGSALKTLDRNSNGVLEDDEITGLNARATGGADGAKKKKKKKT